MNRRLALSLITAAVFLGGCIEDETIVLPLPDETARVFRRYVAMGNSLTAGYMSAGINDSTQRLAYPVILAGMADAGFQIPSLAMPGCPPPLIGVLDTTATDEVVLEEDRVAGGGATNCSLRSLPAPEFVQNVAVPGARMADAADIDRPGNQTNPLTTLILGGLTQVEAMRRAQPSLVTSWLGNNDVLAGALAGDTTLLTPVDTFAFYAERVASGIAGAGPLGVVLIGVVDVTLAPTIQPGLYYWTADSLGFSPKPVNANCAPTDSAGVLNPLSMNELSFSAYADDDITELSCDPSAEYVLTADEIATIQARVQAFNDILRIQVQDRDWMFVNATSELQSAVGTTGRNRLRQCNLLSNELTMAEIVTVVTTQCPHSSAPNFFGSLITFDGVHISASAHQVIADAIAVQLNSKFDLAL